MANQNGEIHPPYRALTCEPNGANVEMIDQVRNQEEDGYQKCTDHQALMHSDVFLADLKIAEDEKYSAQRVKACIDGGKNGQIQWNGSISDVEPDGIKKETPGGSLFRKILIRSALPENPALEVRHHHQYHEYTKDERNQGDKG